MTGSTAFAALVQTADIVGATRSRNAKIAALAELLADVRVEDVPAVTALLVGRPRQGRLGIGWRTLAAARPTAADVSTLTVGDVDGAFTVLADLRGPGSTSARADALETLLARATAAEQDHLVRVISGEMRTGALDAVLLDAAATAAGRSRDLVRRAAMLIGDVGEAARAALGGDDLSTVGLTPGTPVQPMLAGTAASPAAAAEALAPAAVEYKLDGARVQVHRVADAVTVYTRSLADVTARVPELVEVAERLPGGDLVLDGETLTLDEDGRARPFQETMSRFGRSVDDRVLAVYFFDILYGDGRSMVDEPLHARRALLARIVGEHLVPSTEAVGESAAHTADRVFADAVDAGHEGVVVKALDSRYAAGRRGSQWLKVKPVHTLDLVVLAVEEGYGRRTGTLSNLHLGARDPDGRYGAPGGFVMVGKTFKGLTDETLRWQTEHFPTIATGHDGHTVRVRPETVVEVAVDGAQRSTRYPGGVALRFARVRRYRVGVDAKPADDADTVESVRALLRDGEPRDESR